MAYFEDRDEGYSSEEDKSVGEDENSDNYDDISRYNPGYKDIRKLQQDVFKFLRPYFDARSPKISTGGNEGYGGFFKGKMKKNLAPLEKKEIYQIGITGDKLSIYFYNNTYSEWEGPVTYHVVLDAKKLVKE